MVLNVDGRLYTAHFSHRKDTRERWLTKCVIHADRCRAKDCAALFHIGVPGVGVAVCNPVDQFSKKKGRIMSLTRALHSFPREVRGSVWSAYFKVSPHR